MASFYISIHAPPEGRRSHFRRGAQCTPFQFTPLREGRPHTFQRVTSCPAFQFTPLREGRPASSGRRLCPLYFNSRPSARSDDDSLLYLPGDKFQFTPLREGRLQPELLHPRRVVFQFTPLREGRHRSGERGNKPDNFNSRPSARGDLMALAQK